VLGSIGRGVHRVPWSHPDKSEGAGNEHPLAWVAAPAQGAGPTGGGRRPPLVHNPAQRALEVCRVERVGAVGDLGGVIDAVAVGVDERRVGPQHGLVDVG